MREPTVPLPLGWTQHVDSNSGKPYYHHAASATTQWGAPHLNSGRAPPPPPAESEDEEWSRWALEQDLIANASPTTATPMTWAKFAAGTLGGCAILANFAFFLSAAPAAAGRGAPYVPTFTRTVRLVFDDILPRALPRAGQKWPPTRAQHLVDLGSGDGRIVIEGAKQGFTAHGWEINPLVWFPSYLRAAFSTSTKAHTALHCGSFWSVDLAFADVVVIYGLTPIMEELREKIDLEAKEGVIVVSNVFEIPSGTESALELLFSEDQVYVYVKRGHSVVMENIEEGGGEGVPHVDLEREDEEVEVLEEVVRKAS